MNRYIFLLPPILLFLIAPQSTAAAFDGMTLTLVRGPVSGGVTLDWTGGQPTFSVYRSTNKSTVLEPGNVIGTTDVRTFGDTPPPGSIFFYEIVSPCVYNPPEICNGIDDDCNGAVDGPGSETSCNLPNAVAQCASGSCAVASCSSLWGNCDGIAGNGCENNLSTDANCGACGNDCDAGLDACTHRACAARACGPAFDRARCLAPKDVVNQAGACSFAAAGCPSSVDSDGDGLSDTWEDAGAIDANCDGTYDANDVALPDSNKVVKDVYLKIAYMGPSPYPYPFVPNPGVAMCPLSNLTEPPTGHRPQQDSINFVVRAFAGAHLTPEAQPCGGNHIAHGSLVADSPCSSGYSCVDYVCLPNCVSDSDCAASCNGDCAAAGGARCVSQGVGGGKVCRVWRLHVDPLPATGAPHHDIVSYGAVTSACANTAGGVDFASGISYGGSGTPGDAANFYDYKTNVLAPAGDLNFNSKEAAFKHFVLFAHDNTCYRTGSPGCGDPSCPIVDGQAPKPQTTGVSEILGNDGIVSLGVHQIFDIGTVLISEESGALMHELGHSLGLNHGGPVPDPNPVRKVNHLSSMNYIYQVAGIPYTDAVGSTTQVTAHPDFSHQAPLPPLDEWSLNEPDGIGPGGIPPPFEKALIRYNSPATPLCPCPINPCTGLPYPKCGRLGSGVGPIDWNCDGRFDFGIPADINGNGINGEIHAPNGSGDWTNLFYEFQCRTSYVNGAIPGPGQFASSATEQNIDEYRAQGFGAQAPQ